MNLRPYQTHELDSLHRRIDAVFEGFFFDGIQSGFEPRRPQPTEEDAIWTPPIDVYEADNELIVRVELPGMDREAIAVELEDDVLAISGVRPRIEQEGARLRHAESVSGAFRRRFRLGMRMEAKTVRATYTNGVLEVHLPCAETTWQRQISPNESAASSG